MDGDMLKLGWESAKESGGDVGCRNDERFEVVKGGKEEVEYRYRSLVVLALKYIEGRVADVVKMAKSGRF